MREFWIAELRKGSKHYWSSAISTHPRCREIEKDFENAIHVIEFREFQALEDEHSRLQMNTDALVKLTEALRKENRELKKVLARLEQEPTFLKIHMQSEVIANMQKSILELQAERDDYRAALEKCLTGLTDEDCLNAMDVLEKYQKDSV